MKRLIFFLLVLSILPFLVAQEQTLGTFGLDKDIELIQICSNETSLCDSCNISSVLYPNSSVMLSNLEMTKRTSDFNYTVTRGYHIERGVYIVSGFCEAGEEIEVFTYTYEVTNTGEKPLSTAQAIIYIIFLVGILSAMVFTIAGTINISWRHGRNEEGKIIGVNDLRWFKVFLGVISYLLLMWTFGILRSLSFNYLSLAGAERIFNYLYWIMFYFLWPLIVISFVVIVVLLLEGKKIKNLHKRNIFPR